MVPGQPFSLSLFLKWQCSSNRQLSSRSKSLLSKQIQSNRPLFHTIPTKTTLMSRHFSPRYWITQSHSSYSRIEQQVRSTLPFGQRSWSKILKTTNRPQFPDSTYIRPAVSKQMQRTVPNQQFSSIQLVKSSNTTWPMPNSSTVLQPTANSSSVINSPPKCLPPPTQIAKLLLLFPFSSLTG